MFKADLGETSILELIIQQYPRHVLHSWKNYPICHYRMSLW